MQVTPAPPLPPGSAAATQPQAVQTNLHQVNAQATAPISQQAVSPTDKGEKSNKSRKKDDKDPKDNSRKKKEDRGNSLNMSV